MALLSDGNVLIAGGTSTTKVVSSLVLFNESDETFTSIGTLLTARTNAAAAATPDGRVLIVGGTDINGAALASTEIFVYSKRHDDRNHIGRSYHDLSPRERHRYRHV